MASLKARGVRGRGRPFSFDLQYVPFYHDSSTSVCDVLLLEVRTLSLGARMATGYDYSAVYFNTAYAKAFIYMRGNLGNFNIELPLLVQ